ncbi:MAG: alpha/beta fold hydrolase, partial [Deltaproteobacteria bacterium]|nr:alpha/beta fold hydrolase [Deltaproteobacteria bacterium]
MECIEDFVETPDGWRLATYRYPNKSSKKYPVILVHGMGTNRFDLDCSIPRLSLAHYLHRHGYDTWVIELRGVGKSHKKNWVDRCVSSLRFDWTFDDYLFKDLPALVSHIQRQTGSQKLHWAGHSLGGTLIYTAIETMGETMKPNPFASVVTLGSAMSASAKHGL